MAELIIGPLVSLVKEKASSYLLEQYKVMEGMEEQHEILKCKLPAILDVITDAEEQAAHRAGAKAWLEALKKVAYEANDAFDEFEYEALRRKARKDGHYGKLGVVHAVKLFPSHNRIAFRYRMGNKLRKIVQNIEIRVAEMNDFGFRYHAQPQVSKQLRQTDPNIFDPTKIAERSRAKDNQKVVDMLLGQASNPDLTVVPIVGMGGLGKTTLAQLVYNDPQVQKHFQLQAWVCVSDNFDADSLARRIVEAAATNDKDGSKSSPLDRLQKVVSAQRYLIVLDDVWKSRYTFYDEWEKLKARLERGGIGSAVLTTTRDEGVAQAMGTVAYKLTDLENIFLEEIIKTRAFSVQEKKPELVEMVGEIAERCVGSPLAATALGSVLRTKTSVEEWKAVLKKSTICDKETGILPILKLSYDDLPSQMKQCFAFCAVFPKDYEIDVDKMIQIWMANGFVLAQNELRPETIGRRIFDELASRSFFQDVKQVVPVHTYKSIHRYCFRITCKIHDLMHDVAQSVMRKECVTIAEEPNQTELFPSTARHLFLPCEDPQTLLNDSLKKTSPAIQTLLCERYVGGSLPHPSKYRSVRALRLHQRVSTFLLKPKHLHHLRYLDLSYSSIEALPEDISILYNLQTLNLSGCNCLRRLPRQMKYMNALRHLHTNGCGELKCMPPDLRRLTSLQTLTCFVVGTGSDCSNLGELQHLNLCGPLELRQLENVTEEDAKVANLGNKERLSELTLSWTRNKPLEEEGRYHTVLQGLKPHDGLQALNIYSYQGTTFPAWMARMGMLQKVVELCLSGCQKLQQLPPLWQLPELRLLILCDLEKIKFLCSGDTSFTFPKLKELELKRLPDFERWCEIDGRQEEQIMFPQLEKLSIESCEKLTVLPEAPPLRGDHTSFSSAFPELKVIKLGNSKSLKSWGVTEATDGEQPTFPNLEDARVWSCPELTSFPEAPKLSALDIIDSGDQQTCLRAARYAMTSLSSLQLSYHGSEIELPADLADGKEKQNYKSPLSIMKLYGCNFLFRSGALALWKCFVQLQDLSIKRCDGLVHWPEKEFQSLVSLRTLEIYECKELTGYAQPPDQSASERSQLLPCLQSLEIWCCESLVEVFDVAASLKRMLISGCPKLELKFRKREESAVIIDQVEESAVIQCSTDILPPTAVPKLSPSPTELFLPCLESLVLAGCDSISELLNLPSTLTSIWIDGYRNIEILSGQLDALQDLTIMECGRLRSLESCLGGLPSLKSLYLSHCRCLAAIPNGPQAYTSLQSLDIFDCPGIKSLPTCLQQRLKSLERKYIDPRFEGPRLSKPKTWKYAINRDW